MRARYEDYSRSAKDGSVWGQLRGVKDVFRRAAKDVINVTKERGAKTTDEQFYWALQALRSIRNCNLSKLKEAVQASPKLKDLIPSVHLEASLPEQAQRLKDEIKRLAQVGFEEKAKELESVRDLPEYEREHRQSGLARGAAKWSNKSRKAAGLAGVRLKDGSITTDPETACTELGSFWAGTFTEKPINKKLADKSLKLWAAKLPPIVWELCEEEFLKVVAATGDTAPGPDGVPYAAWRKAPREILLILFNAYKV